MSLGDHIVKPERLFACSKLIIKSEYSNFLHESLRLVFVFCRMYERSNSQPRRILPSNSHSGCDCGIRQRSFLKSVFNSFRTGLNCCGTLFIAISCIYPILVWIVYIVWGGGEEGYHERVALVDWWKVASHTTTREEPDRRVVSERNSPPGKANGGKSPHLTGDRERRRATNKRCEGGWGNYKGGGVRVREGGGGKRERTRRRRRRGRREADTGGGNGKRTRRRGRLESYTGGGKHTGRGRPVVLQGRRGESSRGRLENHKRHESHNTTRLNF
jgi:hypothetical protein